MVYNIIHRFVPLAFLATVLCLLVYGAVQQSFRQGANDPQMQMAEDASLNPLGWTGVYGVDANAGNIDIANSLAPYLVVYDTNHTPLTGNGVLNGQYPNLPPGVFDFAKKFGEDRLTWQPEPGVRQAIILIHVDKLGTNVPGKPEDGFVMAGRSLRQVEVREKHLEFQVIAAWLFSIGGLLILEIISAAFETAFLLRGGTRKQAEAPKRARRS